MLRPEEALTGLSARNPVAGRDRSRSPSARVRALRQVADGTAKAWQIPDPLGDRPRWTPGVTLRSGHLRRVVTHSTA